MHVFRFAGCSRWLQALNYAVVFIAATSLLSACASRQPSGDDARAPERPDVTAKLPGRHPPDVIFDTARSDSGRESLGRAAVDDCACTLEHRVNLCVTVDGARDMPPAFTGVSFARVREGGAADTLSRDEVAAGARCFGEWPGVQRVLMLRDTAVVDSSGWFEIQTVDCCHGEARTVDFKRREGP